MKRFLLCLLALSFSTASRSKGQEPIQPPGDEVVIRNTVAAYVEAYNKALADLWSPDAVYTP